MAFRGDRVQQLRELKGWTGRELAERVGVTRARIHQVEAGAAPSLPLAMRLGEVLGIDWRRFFEDTEVSPSR